MSKIEDTIAKCYNVLLNFNEFYMKSFSDGRKISTIDADDDNNQMGEEHKLSNKLKILKESHDSSKKYSKERIQDKKNKTKKEDNIEVLNG